MHPFVIVADDFTGANDTGSNFAEVIPVDAVLDVNQIKDDETSLSIDCESRVVSAGSLSSRL